MHVHQPLQVLSSAQAMLDQMVGAAEQGMQSAQQRLNPALMAKVSHLLPATCIIVMCGGHYSQPFTYQATVSHLPISMLNKFVLGLL